MIKIRTFIFLLLCFSVFQFLVSFAEVPLQQDTVSDYTGMIRPSTKEKVKVLAEELRKVASVNLKVLVVFALPTSTKEAFGREVYDVWDVGQKKEGLDQGVLLIISCIDRKVEIVVGKVLEDILTPHIRNQFAWNIVAELARGHFSEGVELGAGAISRLILMESAGKTPREFIDWRVVTLPVFILIVVSLLLTYFFGGGFYLAFGIIIGGIFGYLFFGLFGLLVGAGLGFFLNFKGRRK